MTFKKALKTHRAALALAQVINASAQAIVVAAKKPRSRKAEKPRQSCDICRTRAVAKGCGYLCGVCFRGFRARAATSPAYLVAWAADIARRHELEAARLYVLRSRTPGTESSVLREIANDLEHKKHRKPPKARR